MGAIGEVQVGPSPASFKFNVAVFQRAREAQQRVYWHFGSWYAFLKLTSFGGKSSKWVERSNQRWSRFLCNVFGDCHIVYGSFNRDNCCHRNEIPWHCRCRASTSASS